MSSRTGVLEYYKEGIQPEAEYYYKGGVPLPFDTAYIDISGLPQQCRKVSPYDKAAKFIVKLKRGNYHLRAQFANCAGIYTSAYYVYVRKLQKR